MKKNLLYLFAILFLAGSVSACSSDNDDEVVSNEHIVGTWKLDPIKIGENLSPLELVIARKNGVKDEDFSIMGGLFKGESAMQMGSQIAGGIVGTVLDEIIFKENMNIVAKYKEMNGMEPIGEWLTSPDGLAKYKCLKGNRLLLSLDAKAIIKEAQIEDEMMISMINKFLKDDFKLLCTFNNDFTTLKITADLLEMTNKNIKPIFDNLLELPEKALEDLGGKDFIENLAKELPIMFKNASKFEANIYLKR